MKKRGRRFLPLLFLCSTLALFPFLSTEKPWAAPSSVSGPVSKPAEPPAKSEDPLGRSTPYGTVLGFIRAAERNDYQRASRYLESKQPAKKKEELARLLKMVLDRGVSLNLNKLNKQLEGNLDSGLRPDLEEVGVAKYGNDSLDILLRRTYPKGAPPIWLFSSETLLNVPDAAEQLELPLNEKIWPKSFRETRLLSVPLSQLVGGILVMLLSLGLSWLLARRLFRVLRPFFLRFLKEIGEAELARLTRPIIFLIFAVLVRILAPLSALILYRMFWKGVATLLIIFALTWFLIRLTSLIKRLSILRMRQAGHLSRIALTDLFTWLVKGLWVIAALLLILHQAGVDLTTAVTGLGIGGVAIAFAAQKTIENLFGTAMVISDQPIRIGDFCKAGDTTGTVESIGLRSTRIRTLDRTLVTIPNGQLAAMSLENFAHREKFLFHHTFGVEWREGISPSRSPKTGHEPLDSSGSYCPALN
jgi:MscS family membrane protein